MNRSPKDTDSGKAGMPPSPKDNPWQGTMPRSSRHLRAGASSLALAEFRQRLAKSLCKMMEASSFDEGGVFRLWFLGIWMPLRAMKQEEKGGYFGEDLVRVALGTSCATEATGRGAPRVTRDPLPTSWLDLC